MYVRATYTENEQSSESIEALLHRDEKMMMLMINGDSDYSSDLVESQADDPIRYCQKHAWTFDESDKEQRVRSFDWKS